MEIRSLEFLCFVAIFLVLYFLVAKIKNAQRYLILIANVFFIYTASGWMGIGLIGLITIISYSFGRIVETQVTIGNKKKSAAFMYLGVILIIGFLLYFKFFKNTYTMLQEIFQSDTFSLPELITPIGISYYTLSMIAYILDIYHKKHKAERDYLKYLSFITFFPSIVEGPINLYKKVAPQFDIPHFPEEQRIVKGLQRMMWGYFKKMVIADRIGIIVNEILSNPDEKGLIVFIVMSFYSFQIYTDFSGGIDVVMGIAEVMDIRLQENFKAPFTAKSVTEFWAKWHMSLGEFMEKYIYYPIVLNRNVMKFSKKIPSSYLQKVFSATIASIIVFVIVGIWHGTGWNYVVYGCYQAFFVSTAVLFGPVYKKIRNVLHIDVNSLSYQIITALRTFVILTLGRYFIKSRDLTQAIELFKRTIVNKYFGQFFDGTLLKYSFRESELYFMYICIILIIIIDIVHSKDVHIRDWIMRQDIVLRYTLYFLCIFGIIIFGIYGPGFDKASYIYQGF